MKWLLRAAQHGAAQGVAQAAALVTGILIVRGLSKTDYAEYSIAVAIIPAIASVADSGISAVLLSRGQAVRTDARGMSLLFRSALRARWALGAPVVLVSLAWLIWLLWGTTGDLLRSAAIAAVVGAILVPSLTLGVLQTYHRVHLDVRVLRRAILFPALARLLLTVGLYLADALSVWSLLAVSLLTSAGAVWYLWHHAHVSRHREAPDPALARDYLGAIRRTLPMTLTVVITSQALLALIALKGSADVLADYSAVSRFGLAFALFAPIVSDIVAPNIARVAADGSRLLRYVAISAAGVVAVVACGAVLVWIFRDLLLGLLGPKYTGLDVALVVVFIGYGVTFVGQALSAVSQSRGWLAGSWTYIPIACVWLACVAFLPSVPDAVAAGALLVSQSAILVLTQMVRIGIGLSRRGRA